MTDALRVVLFGHPVHHSRSPQLFDALRRAGGPAITMELLDVCPADLPRALDDLRVGRWDAAGVTLPHKGMAAAIVDALDDRGRRAGTINAIARRGGNLVGSNTDGAGFIASLQGYRPRRAVVLGSGGAARGVGAALLSQGAEVLVVSRRAEKRTAWIGKATSAVTGWDDPDLVSRVRHADLVVQATSVGMTGAARGRPPLAAEALHRGQRVVDLIYTPWQTPFLALARSRGATATNGWPMLVHQAAVAVDLWLGPGAGALLPAASRSIEARNPHRAPSMAA